MPAFSPIVSLFITVFVYHVYIGYYKYLMQEGMRQETVNTRIKSLILFRQQLFRFIYSFANRQDLYSEGEQPAYSLK